jgi:DNA polymerase elongation subunit (family B)
LAKSKVLLFDLETFPNIAYVWGKWEQDVIKFQREWELASFAYKWLGESEVHCMSRRNLTEKQLVKNLLDLFNSADVLIAHNGDQFDIKKSRAKFIQFGFKPPAINKSIDTKKIAKSQFAFNSNSLNDLGETLGLGKKVETGGFDLWLRCMNNEKAAWGLMEKYNKQDVILLEKVYYKFRSWMPNHPNLAVLEDRAGCATCASTRIQYRGFTPTPKNKKRRYVCLDCGKWDTAALEKKAV